MKTVEWTDERGYDHRALVRDEDSLKVAQQGMGISLDPPPMENIDWEAVKRDLHNNLLRLGVTSWEAVRVTNQMFASALIKSLKRHVIDAFKDTKQQ